MKISEKKMIDFNKISNPCYVVDEEKLENNLNLIKSVEERSGVEIIVAFKAFASWKLFPYIKKYFSTATASSVNEALLASKELGNKAHTYAPSYSEEQFDKIVKASSHITFNSLSQFEKYKNRSISERISCGLRINPEYSEVETDLYNPCVFGSRLGVTEKMLETYGGLPKEIEGLHFHTLCESSSFALEETLKHVEEKFSKYFSQIKWINFGGGHLMTRKDYDTEHLVKLLKDFKLRTGLHVILEPGSAFTWETGYLVSRVEDIVENEGIKTAMLNVSFSCHMPDCLEMPYKPTILNSYHEPVEGKPTYRFGGNSCLAGDFMGEWSFDSPLKSGDTIVFNDMIHYTIVKTTMFNGVHHPSIGIWTKDKVFKLLREFGYEDYKNRLS